MRLIHLVGPMIDTRSMCFCSDAASMLEILANAMILIHLVYHATHSLTLRNP